MNKNTKNALKLNWQPLLSIIWRCHV